MLARVYQKWHYSVLLALVGAVVAAGGVTAVAALRCLSAFDTHESTNDE